MEDQIIVKPLPRQTRQLTFALLILVFVIAIPLLYMYASGYRIDFKKQKNFVSTGGISITVNETEAKIFIDEEEVLATRTFRKSFYAQGIDAGTHLVSVQKEGYHTWVKELPVSERLVTETIAFNLPLVPQVRVISPLQSATGSAIVSAPILFASTTNNLLATSSTSSKSFSENDEYKSLLPHFASTTIADIRAINEKNILRLKSATGTGSTTTVVTEIATTTITRGGVELREKGDEVFATWVGSFESMPYYYCASEFPRYSTSTTSSTPINSELVVEPVPEEENLSEETLVIHPVQTIPEDAACVPTIRIDRKWQTIHDFDFFPGSTDFVVIVLDDSVKLVEVDNRAWQNVQTLMYGKNLRLYIENNSIYVYDGTLIYQILVELE